MRSRSLQPLTGTFAAVVTIGCTLVATLLSPSFAWRENALSNLGVTATDAGTTVTVLLFNGGLIVGGLLGLVFCAVLYRGATGRFHRIVAVLLSLTLVLMALVGVFPQDTAPHFPVASGFYLMITITLWVDALAWRSGGNGAWAVRSGLAGTANILTWIVWVAAGTPWGLAVPEIIGAVIFGTWVTLRSLRVASRF
ncbi:MAG: DUF998 domain-containing protein [Halovenus sp.]